LATPAVYNISQKFNLRLFYIPIDSMKIKVKLSRSTEIKEIKLEDKSIVQDVLNNFNIKPDTVIVMNKNKPIPVDDEVKDGDELTIIRVASGG